jgi:beta-mannosidase
LWNDYKRIFRDSIAAIVKQLDPSRAYWPSSPSLGWGRDSAYKKGDVHYWGVWWGKEPVEKYNEKVGRFNSEYGMQGMPSMKTIRQFSEDESRGQHHAFHTPDDTTLVVMKTHQKHPFGYENIKFYIEQKFKSPEKFEDLVYVSQLMQADAVKTAINAHRKNQPITMGTMFWQWNDCWPVVSWSAIDYYGRKKALYYEVKRSFADPAFLTTLNSGGSELNVTIDNPNNEIYQERAQWIDFRKGVDASEDWQNEWGPGRLTGNRILTNKVRHNEPNGVYVFTLRKKDSIVARDFVFLNDPKELDLPKANIKYRITAGKIELSCPVFAYGVYLDLPDGVEVDDNYFHLLPGEKKIVRFRSSLSLQTIRNSIRIKSLVDTYGK